VLSTAILALGLTATPAGASCGTPKIWLVGFALGDQLPRFYWGTEGSFTNIYARAADFCPKDDTPHVGSTKWQLSAGSASLDEVSPDSGTFNFDGNPSDHTQPVDDFDPVNLADDADELIENVTVSLTSPTEGNLVQPTQAPLYIVDTDGSARVETAPTTSTPAISENQVFKFPIFKAGTGTANVTVTVSGGTPGSDYTQPAPVSFSTTERFKLVTINILQDSSDTGPETYTATITDGGGAGIGTPANMQFTVNDIESDGTAPETSFHHPKHNQTMKYKSPKAKSIHVFVPKDPSGINNAKTALRRVKKSGACQWWDGGGWSPDSCSDAARLDHWLSTKKILTLSNKFVYEHILKEHLAPSEGTKIKHYFVYARATDNAGNTESVVELGRNKNKFEIEKS
jgi:hypothetical protein